MSPDAKRVSRPVRSSRRRSVEQLNLELIEFLERPRPAVRDPEAHRWATSLYRRLVELHETVSRARRKTEEHETLGRLALAHPRAARRLERMRRDRDRLLCDLRAIVNASMTYAEAKIPPNPRLRSWTRSVLDQMRRQDRAETALIQELVNTDVGAGD